MPRALTVASPGTLTIDPQMVPPIVARAGDAAAKRFLEFFTVTIRNPNTRKAYARAAGAFCAWLDEHGVDDLAAIEPLHVAAYIEALSQQQSAPTTKQHLAAIRMLCDWLVTGHVLAVNPAMSVKGPSHAPLRGKTPHLSAEEMGYLLDSIPLDTITGLRDRALIGVMAYTFARIGAALACRVNDVYPQDRALWIRLAEKGGKQHAMPCHHRLAAYLDAYMDAAGLHGQPGTPLFRSATRRRKPVLTERPLTRRNALHMVKRRAIAAGLPAETCNHTFRATGITTFLENGGVIEQARAMAAHASIKTTQVYDRRGAAVTVSEVERIRY